VRIRTTALVMGALLVASACAPTGQTSPSPSGSPGGGTASQPPASGGSLAPSGDAGAVNLFNTDYPTRVTPGTPGGQVIIADWQEANQYNPYYQGQVTEADLASTYVSGFVTTTDDFRYMPDLAADPIPTLDNGGVKVPGDGGHAMTTTWKLRDGLKWSDGKDLTCNDAKFTWQWNMDKDNVGLYGGTVGWEDIDAVDCPDARTVVIQWKRIYEGYLGLFFAILPEHYLGKIAVKDAPTKAYVASDMANVPVSGPYKFEAVTTGQETRMIRNDQWKNAEGRSAYLDRLIFKWYADPDAMIAGYQAGEYDIAKDLQNADLPKVQPLGDVVRRMTALSYEFHRPNWASKVFGDPAVREAYRYAIDKNEINNRIVGGSAKVTDLAISPSTWYFAGEQELTPFDPAKARQILDDAGWKAGADGIRSKGGVRAEVAVCTTLAQYRQDTLALVAGWLKDIGIQANVKAVDSTDIFATWNESTAETPCNLAHGNFDLAEHGFTSALDPLGNYATYHSSQFEPKGSNDAKVSDPAIDSALETVRGTVDFKAIKDAMGEFQKAYIVKTIEVPLYYRDEVWLVNPKVQNFTGNPSSVGPTWNVADWYIKE
jgi:peptide/nickel transport system substrate-binding protein